MLVRALFRQNVPRTHFGRHLVQIRCGQCDQIWRFITIWATFDAHGDNFLASTTQNDFSNENILFPK